VLKRALSASLKQTNRLTDCLHKKALFATKWQKKQKGTIKRTISTLTLHWFCYLFVSLFFHLSPIWREISIKNPSIVSAVDDDCAAGEGDGRHSGVLQLDVREHGGVGRRVRRDGHRRFSPRSETSQHLHRRLREDSHQRRRKSTRRGDRTSVGFNRGQSRTIHEAGEAEASGPGSWYGARHVVRIVSLGAASVFGGRHISSTTILL